MPGGNIATKAAFSVRTFKLQIIVAMGVAMKDMASRIAIRLFLRRRRFVFGKINLNYD